MLVRSKTRMNAMESLKKAVVRERNRSWPAVSHNCSWMRWLRPQPSNGVYVTRFSLFNVFVYGSRTINFITTYTTCRSSYLKSTPTVVMNLCVKESSTYRQSRLVFPTPELPNRRNLNR